MIRVSPEVCKALLGVRRELYRGITILVQLFLFLTGAISSFPPLVAADTYTNQAWRSHLPIVEITQTQHDVWDRSKMILWD
jgi:hypothetical protein